MRRRGFGSNSIRSVNFNMLKPERNAEEERPGIDFERR